MSLGCWRSLALHSTCTQLSLHIKHVQLRTIVQRWQLDVAVGSGGPCAQHQRRARRQAQKQAGAAVLLLLLIAALRGCMMGSGQKGRWCERRSRWRGALHHRARRPSTTFDRKCDTARFAGCRADAHKGCRLLELSSGHGVYWGASRGPSERQVDDLVARVTLSGDRWPLLPLC